MVDQIEAWQNKLLKQYGSRIVYIADELYILANKNFPSYEDYEDFPQIENGVGLVTTLSYEVDEAIKSIKGSKVMPRFNSVSMAVGVSVYPYIKDMIKRISEVVENLKVEVFPIENTYFGKNVTVTGLLTGYDLNRELCEKKLGDILLLSRSMFRAGTTTLLDDITADVLSQKLGVNIKIVENDGQALFDTLVQSC